MTEGRLDRAALLPVLVAAFAQDAVYGLIFLSYMNHYLLDVLDASPGVPGYTLALYGSCKFIVHPIAGKAIDRYSPRLVFRIGIGLEILGMLLLLGSQTLVAFLGGATLLAIGAAALWPLIYELVGRTQTAEARGRATGLLALTGYVATGAGLAVGIALGPMISRNETFLIALSFVALPALLQGSHALERHERRAETQVSTRARSARLAGLVLFASIVLFDYAGITALAGVYGPYARLSLQISLPRMAILLIPAACAALLALGVAARWSRPERRLAEMSLFYGCAMGGAFGLASTSTAWLAACFAIPLALGIGGIGPIIAASMTEQGGTRDRGFVLGTLLSIEGLGAVLGPATIGLVTDIFNPRAGLATIGVMFALLVGLTVVAAHRPTLPAQPLPA